jgi:hypothetical protein
VLPVDEAGKVILPYDKDGKPLIHVAADNVTPLETEQALALVSVLTLVSCSYIFHTASTMVILSTTSLPCTLLRTLASTTGGARRVGRNESTVGKCMDHAN